MGYLGTLYIFRSGLHNDNNYYASTSRQTVISVFQYLCMNAVLVGQQTAQWRTAHSVVTCTVL